MDMLRYKIEKDSINLCYIDPPFNSKRNYFQIYTNVGKEYQAQAQAFVDPWFIVHSAPEQSRLIRTAREVNTAKPELVVAKARAKAARIQNPTIACLGLAYKPDIDDLRESPAVEIALHLAHERIGRVLAVEPHIDVLPKAEAGAELRGADDALAEADIVLGLVAHRRFQKLSRQALQEKIVIDTCGLWR